MTDFDDDDEVVVVGRRLPRLTSISAMDEFNVAVTWEAGTREKEREIVDLAVLLARFKVYAPLRDDPDLFRTVRLQEHRYGVTWDDGTIDMGASTIADAADEAMTAEDFSAFMDRHGFTLDRVAAELGISRRMAAYYKREHKVPRTVALACRYIDIKPSAALSTMAMEPGRNLVEPFGRAVSLSAMIANACLLKDSAITDISTKDAGFAVVRADDSLPVRMKGAFPVGFSPIGWKSGIGHQPPAPRPDMTRKRYQVDD